MTGTAGIDEYEVVIVGAGAAGLATAAALGDHGVATLLVEARTEPPTLPRATVISTRSMELLRAWGLEEETLAGGVDADVWLWECPTLSHMLPPRRRRFRLSSMPGFIQPRSMTRRDQRLPVCRKPPP